CSGHPERAELVHFQPSPHSCHTATGNHTLIDLYKFQRQSPRRQLLFCKAYELPPGNAITRFLGPCQFGGGIVAVRFIEKFFKNELAIDLGTVNTLIYQPGKGILLNEPSVVALDRYDGEVVSVGHKALKLLGREPRGIEVHRPIRSGTIFNFEVSRKMLRTFIGKVTDGYGGYRRGHFVVGIPGSATVVEQRSVR